MRSVIIVERITFCTNENVPSAGVRKRGPDLDLLIEVDIVTPLKVKWNGRMESV